MVTARYRVLKGARKPRRGRVRGDSVAVSGRRARRFAPGDLLRHEGGATAIEYGLLIAAIAVAIIGVVFLVGSDLATLYSRIDDKISGDRDCEQAHENCGMN